MKNQLKQSKADDQYFARFFEEKKDIQEFSYSEVKKDDIWDFNYTLDDMLEVLQAFDAETKSKIRKIMVQIDFKNGDINHFLEYVFTGFAKMQIHGEI